ncbi:MAG: DUF362 domain-containing protein [Opitutales bacterium]|nr:DUF362 domain-containing protein [Opitutales bacterium]
MIKKFLPLLALLPLTLVAEEDKNFYQSIVGSGENLSGTEDLSFSSFPQLTITSGAETINDVSASVPEEAAKKVYPEPHRAFIFESDLADFSQNAYAEEVERLLAAYERTTGRKLVPGKAKKCALKIYAESGRGLETPKNLTLATRDALVRRGFAKEDIYIVGLQEKTMRQTGYLPPFRRKSGDFVWQGSPVIALDTGKFYDARWFFECALPSKDADAYYRADEESIENERKSFYPIPLMFGVDFWISLPVVCDSRSLGISGALANATLWSVSNQRRFLDNPANAVNMVYTVATTPELRDKCELSILSLEKYQFIGGPAFNANYAVSEKSLWLSANPVVLDFIMWQRVNAARQKRGFELILPEPPVFALASKGEKSLGSCVPEEINLVRPKDEASGK